ncbi:MAG: hypothetical protein V4538_16240 [Bacteroidota bacterium]
MGENDMIRELIQQLAGTFNVDVVTSFDCTVDSVNEDNFTCDVTAIGSNATTNVPEVRLASESNDGFKIIPKIGSTVTIIKTKRGVAYVSMFSDISKIIFMDGSLGGMVKVIPLVTKLNVLEAHVNAIKGVVSAIIAAGTSSPGTPVTNATLAAYFSAFNVTAIIPTERDDIENTLIQQGN